MAIEVIPINGKSPYVDYNVFEVSVKEILGSYCKNAKIFLLNNFPIVISTQIKIDLLLIIAIENIGGNYYIIKKVKKIIRIFIFTIKSFQFLSLLNMKITSYIRKRTLYLQKMKIFILILK